MDTEFQKYLMKEFEEIKSSQKEMGGNIQMILLNSAGYATKVELAEVKKIAEDKCESCKKENHSEHNGLRAQIISIYVILLGALASLYALALGFIKPPQ